MFQRRMDATRFADLKPDSEPTVKKLVVLGIASALATGVALGASAQANDAAREIATAQIHAHAAEMMDTVSASHLHLHHVINCLVGVNGAGYSAAAERLSANPCKGLGGGALPDSAADAQAHSRLESALADAQTGLKANTLKTVHADAAKVAAALQVSRQ